MDDAESVDLSGVSLRDLRRLPAADLEPALRRVLEQLDDGGEPVAGFQSSV